jgi:hypothetical protein
VFILNYLITQISVNTTTNNNYVYSLQRHVSTRISHRQAMIRSIYVYKVIVPILGSQKLTSLLHRSYLMYYNYNTLKWHMLQPSIVIQ